MIRFDIENEREITGIRGSAIARAGIIRSSEIDDIPTPLPVATSSELNRIEKINDSNMTDQIEIPNQIIEIAKGFRDETLPLLNLKNPSLNNPIFDKYKLELFRYARKFVGKIRIFRPLIDKNIRIDISLSNFLTELAIQSDMDWILAQDPHFTSDIQDFERRANRIRDTVYDDVIRKHTKDIIPVVWLGSKERNFEGKINSIVNNGFPVIGGVFASVYTYRSNYVYLKEIATKHQIPVIMFDVDKTWKGNYTTAMNHFLSFFKIDMISLKPRIKLPKEIWLKITGKPMKRLDRPTLGHIKPDEQRKLYENDLNCGCPVDANENYDSFGTKFAGADLLPQAIGAHNMHVTNMEFSNERREIMNDNLKGYIRSKLYLKQAIEKVLGTNTGLRGLKEF